MRGTDTARLWAAVAVLSGLLGVNFLADLLRAHGL